MEVQPLAAGVGGNGAARLAGLPLSGVLDLMRGMDGVGVDDRLVGAEGVAQVLMPLDEGSLRLRVGLGGDGFRLAPDEVDPRQKLDQPGSSVVDAELFLDEGADLGGRAGQCLRRPLAQFLNLRRASAQKPPFRSNMMRLSTPPSA